MRIEVWFNNGLFRAFPKVKKETLIAEDKNQRELTFVFGGGEHEAVINMENVNFIEVMENEN